MTRGKQDDPRIESRKRGVISGAVFRGEVWPVGTRVRWTKGKVTYQIDAIRFYGKFGHERFNVHLVPEGGVRRGVHACWTSIEYLTQV